LDDQAFAYLARGIVDFAGLRFDREGRLLDPEDAEQPGKREGSWID
jgi:hypothetical protein